MILFTMTITSFEAVNHNNKSRIKYVLKLAYQTLYSVNCANKNYEKLTSKLL